MGRSLLGAGVIVCFASLAAHGAAPGPAFEVASIKAHVQGPLNGPYERAGIEDNAAGIRIENLSLRTVIEIAWQVRDFQLVGPGWLGSARFDIDGKPPAGYKHEQLQPMLQRLLEERFKLALHHESKSMTAYFLVVAKGGPKFGEAAGPRGFFTARPGLISGTRVSMSEVVNAMAGMLGRPVVDKTGLTKAYDLKLAWMPDDGSTRDSDGAEPGPSFFTAIQEQLGLRVKSGKARVDIVVVDRVARVPSEN
jgi:uncharacterized protein (TIGR03435 family)